MTINVSQNYFIKKIFFSKYLLHINIIWKYNTPFISAKDEDNIYSNNLDKDKTKQFPCLDDYLDNFT